MAIWRVITVDVAETSSVPHPYRDVLGEHFSYDNSVANSSKLRIQDIVLIQGKGRLLGAAQIQRIKEYPDTKRRPRCPHCGRTAIFLRPSAEPAERWGCRNKACRNPSRRFAAPRYTDDQCIWRIAHYGGSFQPALGHLAVEVLKESVGNKRNAISPLDLRRLNLEREEPDVARFIYQCLGRPGVLGTRVTEAHGLGAEGAGTLP